MTVDVRLKPRASKCAVKRAGARSLDVSVTSPPVDDRANGQLLELLADVFGVGKTSLSIIKGGHSRNKAVSVCGLTEGEFEKALNNINIKL